MCIFERTLDFLYLELYLLFIIQIGKVESIVVYIFNSLFSVVKQKSIKDF